MSRTNNVDAPLFQVDHHHSAASGTPPHLADLSPSHDLGCFEKRYAEQAIFVYERDSTGKPSSTWVTPAGRRYSRWSMVPCPMCSYQRPSWGGCAPGGGRRLLPMIDHPGRWPG